MTATGKLSDGRFLRGIPATVDFQDGGAVRVSTEAGITEYQRDSVRASDRLGSIPRFVYLPDGSVFETPDNDAIDAGLETADRQPLATLIHFLEARSGIAAGATVLLVLALVLTLHYGLPVVARHVARKTPPAIEKEVGRLALATISQHLGLSALPQSERIRARLQLRRILPEVPSESLPVLEFRSTGHRFANAFALPGGIIVVTDDLVELATDDEIAAVLAHEVGHLREHHGIQAVLNHSFALLIVTSLTGDLSTLTTFAGSIPFLILQNGYSRDHESEADLFARELLRARHIPLGGFASILKKIEADRPQQGPDFTYLSTHPNTDERIKLFRDDPAPPAGEP